MSLEHDALQESTALYVLGALAPDERRTFEQHLQTCDECRAEVRALGEMTDALLLAAVPAEPAPALRERVLRAAAGARTPVAVPVDAASRTTPHTRTRRLPAVAVVGWLAAAAALVVAVRLEVRATRLDARLEDAEVRLADAVSRLAVSDQRLQTSIRETTAVRTSLALLTAPDSVELRLAGQPPARSATGRAFLSRSRGLLFAATNLPSIPQDRTYQVWYLTRGAPVSAGLIRPDADGNATASFDVPAPAPAAVGMAVSLEPDGGVPAPTGAIYLASQ